MKTPCHRNYRVSLMGCSPVHLISIFHDPCDRFMSHFPIPPIIRVALPSGHRPGFAQNAILLKRIKVIGWSSPKSKNFPFRAQPKSVAYPLPSRLPEGRFAIVTDVRRDAVDASGASDEGTNCGRRSRVVLTSRRWRQVCGFNSQATVTTKPDHRGEREGNRKTIARGMPGVSRCDRGD